MAKLKPYAEWEAPWEKSGDEFDAEKAKKFVYDLTADKERLAEEKAAASSERDEFKTKVEEQEAAGLSESEKLQKQLEELKANPPKDESAQLENVRLRLAITKGLTEAQANRLRGNSPEELEADVAVMLEELGESREKPERDAPKGRFTTGNEGGPDDDFDAIIDDPEKLAGLFNK